MHNLPFKQFTSMPALEFHAKRHRQYCTQPTERRMKSNNDSDCICFFDEIHHPVDMHSLLNAAHQKSVLKFVPMHQGTIGQPYLFNQTPVLRCRSSTLLSPSSHLGRRSCLYRSRRRRFRWRRQRRRTLYSWLYSSTPSRRSSH